MGHFLNFVSLVFLEIAYNYSLQQCITSSRDKNPQNKFLGPNLGQNGPKLSLILGFQPFFHFYNDSLQQCLTFSRGKVHEKKFWALIWTKGAKIGPKTVFCHFLRFGSLVFLEISCNYSLQQCLTTSRGKTHQKNFWDPNLGQIGPNGLQNYVVCCFLKFGALVFF